MMKFSSQLFLILPLAMGIGVAMAFQTAINAQLREQLHSPLQAALLSFFLCTRQISQNPYPIRILPS